MSEYISSMLAGITQTHYAQALLSIAAGAAILYTYTSYKRKKKFEPQKHYIPDLNSPLEKAILYTKMLSSSVKTEGEAELVQLLLDCLVHSNLTVPDLQHQLMEGSVIVDGEQEKWLFNELAKSENGSSHAVYTPDMDTKKNLGKKDSTVGLFGSPSFSARNLGKSEFSHSVRAGSKDSPRATSKTDVGSRSRLGTTGSTFNSTNNSSGALMQDGRRMSVTKSQPAHMSPHMHRTNTSSSAPGGTSSMKRSSVHGKEYFESGSVDSRSEHSGGSRSDCASPPKRSPVGSRSEISSPLIPNRNSLGSRDNNSPHGRRHSFTLKPELMFSISSLIELPESQQHELTIADLNAQGQLTPDLLRYHAILPIMEPPEIVLSVTEDAFKVEPIGSPLDFDLDWNNQCLMMLSAITDYNFPIFEFDFATQNRPLTAMAHHLIINSGLLTRLDLPRDVFSSFIIKIENGYNPNLTCIYN
jgi:hypothetical protein